MKIKRKIKNFLKYIKDGGITNVQIIQNFDTNELSGKTVIVTGGTSGIGYEIAKICQKLGAEVIITARNLEKLNEVKKELNCKILEWDISNINLTHKKIEELIELSDGKIDCFINNAGIYKDVRYTECSIEDWENIIKTNLSGTYFATTELIKQYFKKKNKGNIIMIGSNRGIFGDDGPYGVSKAGIINFSQGLAKEVLKNNIRINVVNPGMTASSINNINENDNMYRHYLKGNRVLLAKEIATIVAFFVSDKSKCITGQVINCDNGESIL